MKKLTKVEEKAFKRLTWLGWKPERCTMPGYPDFKCSDNRYVEVKQIHVQCLFERTQIKWIQEMTTIPHVKVYIIIYDSDGTYMGMFRMHAIDFPDAGIKMNRGGNQPTRL